jgi:hypothetical protein
MARRALKPRKEAEQTPLDTQLANYEKVAVVYDQIFELHRYIISVLSFFIPITAGIWSVAAGDALKLGTGPKVALLVLQMVGCVWLSVVIFGALRSIRGRFILVDVLGIAFFPKILSTSRKNFKGGTLTQWASWGRNRKDWFWYLVPLGSFCGSAYLIAYVM